MQNQHLGNFDWSLHQYPIMEIINVVHQWNETDSQQRVNEIMKGRERHREGET